ncbi:hypothetical protein [Thermotoga profunda]|uniref:hypothetical protein n=1 Tax=Thermotoga profunda TaxID=1508420 RepID=UPI000597997B|nr:hypothetical protein [Thermotoga profunda]
MRKLGLILILFFSMLSFGSYLTFDTNDGVALHFPMNGFEVFVGYRYSGFSFSYPLWEIGSRVEMAIDPFSQSGYLMGGVYVEKDNSHLELGLMPSILSEQDNGSRFIKRGNLDFYLKASHQMNLLGFELLAQKTLLGFYTDTNKQLTFVIPPLELESMGVLLQPSVKFNLGQSPKVSIKIGYILNLSWTQSLPSALMNLGGFRITFAVGDF